MDIVYRRLEASGRQVSLRGRGTKNENGRMLAFKAS